MTHDKKIMYLDALIVGAGFSGLYMLHLLRDKLNLNVTVIESASGVGGTWYWNRYPGARCDIASHEYSYTFSEELQQEWVWSEKYAAQPEILRYLEHVEERFNLHKNIQFNENVTSAVYDEQLNRWLIKTSRDNQFSAQFFIPASGTLSSASVPNIPGQNDFTGETYLTSRWPEGGVDLKGKRVGIIGTGATAIQAIPIIAKECEHLTVFQRTANYASPLQNEPMTKEYDNNIKANYSKLREAEWNSFAGMPFDLVRSSALADSDEERRAHFQHMWDKGSFGIWLGSYADILFDEQANKTAADFIRSKIHERVDNPKIAELLCPEQDQLYGIKRQPCETDYFETFNRQNVTLADLKSAPLKELTATSVKTTDNEYEVDVLIYATGFDAFTGSLFKMGITGQQGKTLKEYWSDGPRTYLGVTVSNFPNMFTITGPQSPSVLFNMPLAIEMHCNWIADCIQYMKKNNQVVIQAEPSYEEDWVTHTKEVADTTLFPKANSWYMGANIPGKPRVFLVYVAGGKIYQDIINDRAANNYEGFSFKTSAN